MRTSEWFNSRVDRAADRFRQARRDRRFGQDTMLEAMHEVSGHGTPNIEDASVLSEALGVLTADEYRHLLGEASHALSRLSDDETRSAEWLVGKGLTELGAAAGQSGEEPTVAKLRRQREFNWSPLIQQAVILQALVWAVESPGDYVR